MFRNNLIPLLFLFLCVHEAQAAYTDAMAFHMQTISSVSYMERYFDSASNGYDGGALIVIGSGNRYFGTKTAGVNNFAWNSNALGDLSVQIPLGVSLGGEYVPSQFGLACSLLAEFAKTKGWAFRYAVGDVCNTGVSQLPMFQADQATCNPPTISTGCTFRPQYAYNAMGASMYSAGTYYSSGNHMCGIQIDSGTRQWLWVSTDVTAANSLSGLFTNNDSAATPNAGSFPTTRTLTCGGSVDYATVSTGILTTAWAATPDSYTSGGTTVMMPVMTTSFWRCFKRVLKYLYTNSTPYIMNPGCLLTPEP